ncbi:hypothetical protein PIB30_066408 [Stylosanthes scabra]|uniref:Uncharacterized protein n=1 Tax=Stylosanthes scabra TaxID=79078 RepID=A0ABU6ZL03_9FABA|nr:hypothetical protein [Stylosanthes scabra]
MDSEGVSTSSKRGGGGRRKDRSSGSTQGFFATRVTDEREGAAPGMYVSKWIVIIHSWMLICWVCLVVDVPEKLQHCKFFMWLDSHTAKFGRGVAVGGSDANEDCNDPTFSVS